MQTKCKLVMLAFSAQKLYLCSKKRKSDEEIDAVIAAHPAAPVMSRRTRILANLSLAGRMDIEA